MTRTSLSRSKGQSLRSPGRFAHRRVGASDMQRWAWERVGRGKLMLRCRLLGGARRFGAHGGWEGGAYRGGLPPIASFVVDRKNNIFVIFLRVSQFSWWSRDHFSAALRGLYLPNAWSQTLLTSKRHTFRVSAFHRYHWFGVKLFPVSCAQDSRRAP